jgi:two-component system response regulator VanR
VAGDARSRGHGNGHHLGSLVAHVQVGRIRVDVRELEVVQGPGAERADGLVRAGADPGDLGLAENHWTQLTLTRRDIAGDGNIALELLSVNAYDIAVLDRDIPGPSGDEIAERIVASGSGMPILMLTAADRLDDKASGFELGADDYLTKPFELRELVLRLRALDRRRAHSRPPVREIAGLRLDPFRREVYRDGRYVALTRKQFAVLEVLVAAEGGVISAEELLERAWDENADPFTNAVRITVSALRKRLGEPWIIATVAGVGYRIDTQPDTGREGEDHG